MNWRETFRNYIIQAIIKVEGHVIYKWKDKELGIL